MLQRLLLTGTLSLAMICLGAVADAQRQVYSDKDWNTLFVDNCGLPNAGSVETVKIGGDQKLRFTLAKGDKGRCSSDDRRRHRAPYWERAELAQEGRMRVGHLYRISAEIEIVRGFKGDREAFFQIHGWTSACQEANPPLMVKFHKGKLRVEALRGVSATRSGKHRNALRKRVKVRSLYGKPMKLVVDFDTRTQPGRFSLSLGGQVLVSDAKVEFTACAEPHVKFGIYRPGGKATGTSVAVFDDLVVERVE